MNKKRNIAGLTVVVSNETYNEYKGTLQEQIDELQQRIDKAIEYLKYIIELDEDDLEVMVAKKGLEILGDGNNE